MPPQETCCSRSAFETTFIFPFRLSNMTTVSVTMRNISGSLSPVFLSSGMAFEKSHHVVADIADETTEKPRKARNINRVVCLDLLFYHFKRIVRLQISGTLFCGLLSLPFSPSSRITLDGLRPEKRIPCPLLAAFNALEQERRRTAEFHGG